MPIPSRTRLTPLAERTCFSQVHTISAEERVLASRLAEWREEVATTINKPRNFIMRDDAILDLVLMARRAHKYFPVHRAGVNTMHLSRAGGLQPRGGDHVGGPLGALAPCVSPQRFRWTKAIECTYTNSNESCVFLSR